jgi:hypothetical protein
LDNQNVDFSMIQNPTYKKGADFLRTNRILNSFLISVQQNKWGWVLNEPEKRECKMKLLQRIGIKCCRSVKYNERVTVDQGSKSLASA